MDLKIDSVLLSGEGVVKLADFGHSLMKSECNELLEDFVGTWATTSPEMISELRAGTFTDIWSLGIIIYQLCTLHIPDSQEEQELFNYADYVQAHPIPPSYSKKLRALVDWALQPDYRLRPTPEQILTYNWIEEDFDRQSLFKQELSLASVDKKIERPEGANFLGPFNITQTSSYLHTC